MEGSPVPPGADPGGHSVIPFVRYGGLLVLCVCLYLFIFLQLGKIIPVHHLHMFVGSLCLSFLSALSLVSDGLCSPSF